MADFYIDPDTGTGTGDGSEPDPFAAWSEATFAAGNNYYQKKGTTATETVTVDVTGTSGSHITLGAYGTGDNPIISGSTTETHGLVCDAVSYVDISDFRITACTQKGLHIKGNITDITVTDCVADNIPGSAAGIGNGVGISVDNQSVTSLAADNITFLRCTAHTCGRMGFDTQSTGTNYQWIECIAYNNGANYDGGGFYAHPYRTTVTSGWTNVSGDIYTRPVIGGQDVVSVVYWLEGVLFLTETASATPAAGEFYYVSGASGELRVNLGIGVDPNTQEMNYSRGPQSNFKWIKCLSYSNKSEPGGTHGSGIQLDDLIADSLVDRCISHDNDGVGINLFKGQRNTINSSIAYNNGSVTGNGIQCNRQEDSIVCNCVTYENTRDGVSVGAGTTDVYNNISHTNGEAGIQITTGTCNSYTNYYYNNTDGATNVVSGTLNQTDDSTTDPLFITDTYELQETSPCVGTGTKWWGNDPRPTSLSGEPLPDTKIDIGAYQSTWDANHPKNL